MILVNDIGHHHQQRRAPTIVAEAGLERELNQTAPCTLL